MSFIELAEKRFSAKKFSAQPVEQVKLDLIVKAAMLAPTAKNLQPFRLYVLKSAEALAKVDSLTHIRYGAPVVLMFTRRTDEEWVNPFEENIRAGVEDVSIAATHAMLEAADLGVGSCWCNYFPNSKVEEVFGLGADENVVVLMPIGYAPDFKPLPNHTSRRPVAELVKEL